MRMKFIFFSITGILFVFLSAQASNLNNYKEFYLSLHKNSIHKYVFCLPTENPEKYPEVFGVKRDSLSRIIEFTKFAFGNIDTKVDWTITRISYSLIDSIGCIKELRTYFNRIGMPIGLGWVHAEELIYREKSGNLLSRKLYRTDGKTPAGDSVKIHENIYKLQKGIITQTFYNYNGKMCHGENTEQLLQSLSNVPYSAFYRKMKLDTLGNATEEYILDFDKKNIPYSDGVYVKKYNYNDCGFVEGVMFYNIDSTIMKNSLGVNGEEYKYDNFGRLIELKFVNQNKINIERTTDYAAIIKYVYRDFDGVLISTKYFNIKGKEL